MEPTKSEIKTGLIRERDSGGQSQETTTESWSLKMNRKQPQHSNTTGIWTLSKKYDTRKLYLSQETLTKGTITHKKRLIIKKSKQEIQTQPNNNPKKRSRMAKQKPGIQKWLKTLGFGHAIFMLHFFKSFKYFRSLFVCINKPYWDATWGVYPKPRTWTKVKLKPSF